MSDDIKRIKWIKLDVNLFNDEKIKQLKSMPEGYGLIVIWIQLLCLAGRSNNDGYIFMTPEIPYTDEMLCNEFGCTPPLLKLALGLFQQFGMIEIISDVYHVSNWRRHQSADKLDTIREQNRIRKQKQRRLQQIDSAQLAGECDMSRDTSRDSHAFPLTLTSNTLNSSSEPKKRTKKNEEKRLEYGTYHWVKLTADEHARLVADLGEQELTRCIQYIDESAQTTSNKNKWRDWNLVLRRCSRCKWGLNDGVPNHSKPYDKQPALSGNPFRGDFDE